MITTTERICKEFVKLPILQSSQVDLVPNSEIFDCIPSGVTTHASSLWEGGCGSTQPRKAVKKYSSLNIYYFILSVWEIPCHWSMVNVWASATVNEYTDWCNRGSAWEFPMLESGWSTKGTECILNLIR